MIISGSLWRKGFVTVIAVGGFVSLYEAKTLDSKYAARQAVLRETTALPSPGARLAFSATSRDQEIDNATAIKLKHQLAPLLQTDRTAYVTGKADLIAELLTQARQRNS